MGLRGHPPTVAAAVHALLGPDPRFLALDEDTWALAEPRRPLQPPLRSLDYAVVDLETTGSLRWRGHGIVEIAVVHVTGGVVTDRWHTLLDPGRRVAPFVTELTGITPSMVRGAPSFEHVAATVFELLEGRVFVAHNVGFDWGFVASHLERTLGRVPHVPRLCTVHMARRFLPRLRARNLDALADHFGLPIQGRHRALGDALCTARVLLRLLDSAELEGVCDLDTLQRRLAQPLRRSGSRRRAAGRA